MADLRGTAQQKNISIVDDGQYKNARFTRKGDLVVVNYGIAAGFEGALFGVNFGSVTTPLATAATTAIAAQRPMAWLRVPATRSILPVSCEIVVESQGGTTQGEIAIAIAHNDVGNGTSTAATTATPIALNPRVSKASAIVPRNLSTGDCTAESNYLELKRFSFAASAVNQHFTWEPSQWLPPLTGPASFLVYIGGNAVNCYVQMIWIEDDVALTN